MTGLTRASAGPCMVRAVCAAAAALVLAAGMLAYAASARAEEAVTFSDVSARDISTLVRVEEGVGGTRVVTPYYAVFLEDQLFPDGFAYEYVESADGAYGILNVYVAQFVSADEALAAGSDESSGDGVGAGSPAYRIYCVDQGESTAPFGGSYATAETLGSVGDGSYRTVVVAVPYGSGFSDEAEASAEGDGSEDARQQALEMCGHVSPETVTHTVARDDGGIDIQTPWYTVTIPADLFPDGWYYTYSDDVADWSGDGSGAYFGRVLNVIPVGDLQAAFSVCCVKDFSVQGEVVEVTVGVFEGDWAGWRIDVYRTADFSTQTFEEALAQLEPYAALVSVTDTPNANPPSL